MLVGDSGRITGNSQVILHSRAMLAEMFLQTALGAMIQFHLPGKFYKGRSQEKTHLPRLEFFLLLSP
jgi:hypothetical protein